MIISAKYIGDWLLWTGYLPQAFLSPVKLWLQSIKIQYIKLCNRYIHIDCPPSFALQTYFENEDVRVGLDLLFNDS